TPRPPMGLRRPGWRGSLHGSVRDSLLRPRAGSAPWKGFFLLGRDWLDAGGNGLVQALEPVRELRPRQAEHARSRREIAVGLVHCRFDQRRFDLVQGPDAVEHGLAQLLPRV